MTKSIRRWKQQKLSFDPFFRGKKMSFDLRVNEMSYETHLSISTSLIARAKCDETFYFLFFGFTCFILPF